MKPIGGFFELEIAEAQSIYHEKAIKLATGRACLNHVLSLLKPSKVYLPYYCCNALFEPMILNEIEYEFYAINEQLEIIRPPNLKHNEFIIYTDFFGIKTKYTNSLIRLYSEKLIVDNTHSFFLKGYKSPNYSFTSARKYFGVPDGAFLYTPSYLNINISMMRNANVSVQHNVHRLVGLQEKAYAEYIEYEKGLGSEIEIISILSEKILSTINYKEVRKIRNENLNFLREEFGNINLLKIDENEKDCFCYPLLLEKPIEKEILSNERIFIPNLWMDTLSRKEKNKFELECKISNELLPLPIDHRYTLKDMKRVSETIKRNINGKR